MMMSCIGTGVWAFAFFAITMKSQSEDVLLRIDTRLEKRGIAKCLPMCSEGDVELITVP